LSPLWLGLALCGKAPVRAEVEGRIRAVPVRYLDFSGVVRAGVVEVDSSLAGDVQAIFGEILRAGFPLRQVRPVREFGNDDDSSMAADNTSGWNWREARGTGRLSWHALGRAIDLNPRENPWVKGRRTRPEGARRDTSMPGTLRRGDAVTEAFRRHGWSWGGRWGRVKDYQHFEKPLPGTDLGISPGERGAGCGTRDRSPKAPSRP
jgi:hypothetical protein